MYKTKTPIIDALQKYNSDRIIRWHMPGHKGGQMTHNPALQFLGDRVYQADVTNVPGMDDLHQPQGIIKEAQELAAATFGADKTYFLINGSSCGLQALVMASCKPGEKILVPRNIHRSILSGIILSGAVPVFFMPEYDYDYGIPLGTTPAGIAACLQKHPDVRAVLLVYPTYQGIASDIETIAQIVHQHGLPLLVDEAHGPHFGFHEDLPKAALLAGADAVVQGTHKMLSSFTQASMLHLKGNRLNQQRLESMLRLLQSTSTSYLLLSSLDGARAQLAHHGRELTESALELSHFLRAELKTLGLQVLGEEMLGQPGVYGLDLTKITISLRSLKVSGLWAEKWLRETYRLQVEMADVFNLLLLVTFGNWRSDANNLLSALSDMAYTLKTSPQITAAHGAVENINPYPVIPELALPPREAFWSSPTPVPLSAAVGHISAEVITCYPPGIPVICPGERYNQDIIDYLIAMRHLGVHFQGSFDTSLATVQVLK